MSAIVGRSYGGPIFVSAIDSDHRMMPGITMDAAEARRVASQLIQEAERSEAEAAEIARNGKQ